MHKNTRVTPLTATEARELFEIRMALDPAAAELAAQRRTDADIKTLRNAAKHLVPVTRTWGRRGCWPTPRSTAPSTWRRTTTT